VDICTALRENLKIPPLYNDQPAVIDPAAARIMKQLSLKA